ncbi:MAG TPA: hypothetical protein VFB79_14450 [Candidatus Angelobacter sp.]|nr:hypothetical protein [Candidatus Angelobacter sp.]
MNRLRMLLMGAALVTAGSALASAQVYHHPEDRAYSEARIVRDDHRYERERVDRDRVDRDRFERRAYFNHVERRWDGHRWMYWDGYRWCY